MEKQTPASGAHPQWPAALDVDDIFSRPASGNGTPAAKAFDPMVVGTARFDSDEECAAALNRALEEGLASGVVEDFDPVAFLREVEKEWDDAGL